MGCPTQVGRTPSLNANEKQTFLSVESENWQITTTEVTGDYQGQKEQTTRRQVTADSVRRTADWASCLCESNCRCYQQKFTTRDKNLRSEESARMRQKVALDSPTLVTPRRMALPCAGGGRRESYDYPGENGNILSFLRNKSLFRIQLLEFCGYFSRLVDSSFNRSTKLTTKQEFLMRL